MNFKRKPAEKVWLNTAAGAIGGMLGAWTMNQFQAGVSKLQAPAKAAAHPFREDVPATVKMAENISEITTGHHLTEKEKKKAEPVVHYGFGAFVGAVYGALAAKAPLAKTGSGTVYGAAVWLLADEIGVPAAGLSKPPNQIPARKHFEALASHLVYGLTVEGVRWLSGKTRFA
jgi:putative membrane protein